MRRPTLPQDASRSPRGPLARRGARTGRAGAPARLASLLRHLPCAVAFKGADGQVDQLNARAEALVGRWIEATPRASAPLLFTLEEAQRCRDEDEAGLCRGLTFRREDTLLLPDGTTRTLLVRKFPVQGEDGRIQGMGVVALDLPEAAETATGPPPRHRLEVMGLLAGGLAHDFNNLLTAAFGNLELLQLELGTDTRARPFLENLEALATRGAALVDQLLACSGQGWTQKLPLDLNGLVEETLGVLRASLSSRAALRWNPGQDLPPLVGDPRQLRRVVTNLVLNAVEAMDPWGGTVTLATGQRGLEPEATGEPWPGFHAGPHLLLEVADSGTGMARDVQERLFEPFFTTKEVGRGLGLSAVQEILRAHGGGLRIHTESGRGTRVEVFLPLLPASSDPTPVPGEDLPASSPPALLLAQGTILVVDDEPLVRSVAAGALRRMGFETLEAASGREAVTLAQGHRDRIRLILMDFIMPELDGMEAYREIRRLGLRTPVVLSSGFGRGEAHYRLKGKGLAGFLPKPYRFRLLSETVMRALAREMPPEVGPELAPEPGPCAPPVGALGVPDLDEGHQALHRACVDLARMVGSRDSDAVKRRMEAFLDRFAEQSRREETWMDRAGFPGCASHRESHARILAHLQRLAADLEAGGGRLTPASLDFIEGLVFCHEEVEDPEFVRFLT